jgi:hypothetical protein
VGECSRQYADDEQRSVLRLQGLDTGEDDGIGSTHSTVRFRPCQDDARSHPSRDGHGPPSGLQSYAIGGMPWQPPGRLRTAGHRPNRHAPRPAPRARASGGHLDPATTGRRSGEASRRGGVAYGVDGNGVIDREGAGRRPTQAARWAALPAAAEIPCEGPNVRAGAAVASPGAAVPRGRSDRAWNVTIRGELRRLAAPGERTPVDRRPFVRRTRAGAARGSPRGRQGRFDRLPPGRWCLIGQFARGHLVDAAPKRPWPDTPWWPQVELDNLWQARVNGSTPEQRDRASRHDRSARAREAADESTMSSMWARRGLSRAGSVDHGPPRRGRPSASAATTASPRSGRPSADAKGAWRRGSSVTAALAGRRSATGTTAARASTSGSGGTPLLPGVATAAPRPAERGVSTPPGLVRTDSRVSGPSRLRGSRPPRCPTGPAGR